ncbi:MAG: MBOAT family protein [Treponemataceae bacterium]|nr:MAG: MBOAT family protein [Treponemataceae bacterium]
MLFSSITFLIFFLPITLLVYYYCPFIRVKNYFLLFASLIFYAWGEPKYVLIMLFSIALNYRMGLWIGETSYTASKRKIVLAAAITANLLLLFYFKYLGFAERVLNKIALFFNHAEFTVSISDIALPIGISFYTFQSISYLVDVYKKPALIQKNLLDIGLYISFFPALIAGPIVRYHDVSEQIKNRPHRLDLFVQGVERFIIGLSKKVLIANTLAEVADNILVLVPNSVSAFYLLLGIVSYSLQIYYDFSGYSDMAIGLGKMFGFDLRENFNYPYMSKSITEFWRRWHISLSSWFKDYLYIPLGGNRKGKARTILNLFVVFFATGLWHGAALHFVFWGLGHGVLLFLEKTFGKKINRVFKDGAAKSVLSHIYTLCSIMLLWVLFTLSIRDTAHFIKDLFFLNDGNVSANIRIKISIGTQFYVSLVFAVIFAFPWWRKIKTLHSTSKTKLFSHIRYAVLPVLLILSMCMLATNAYNPFIYFRF